MDVMSTRELTEAAQLCLLPFDTIRTKRQAIMRRSLSHLLLLCSSLPADGRLAVRRPLGGAQCLAHLGLCEAQGQPADLECFGEFTDLLQVDPVHLAGGGLRVYDTTNTTHLILLALCSSVAYLIFQEQSFRLMRL